MIEQCWSFMFICPLLIFGLNQAHGPLGSQVFVFVFGVWTVLNANKAKMFALYLLISKIIEVNNYKRDYGLQN